jgi:serine/threonine protein kinase
VDYESPQPGERRARLERVREELRRAAAANQKSDRAEILRRYSDLEPELSAILAEFGDTLDAGLVPTAEAVTAAPPTHAASGVASEATDDFGPSGWIGGDVGAATRTAAPSGANGRAAGVPHPPGSRIRYVGDYELGEVLGQGGMGVVYRARQVSVNRLVAVKMIRNAAFAGDDQLKRFQNEAEAVALLDHPGIVPIYEVGSYGDERYFSMKLIEGKNLDARLPALARDPRAAAALVAEVADAVNHAHQRGILHRDLKPANILVDARGAPHVTDFGLARKIEGDAGLTVSGAIMGTPAYMSPEQALGRTREVTTATDVYGLGGILYAALTGRAPFSSDSVLETLEQVRHRPPEVPTKRNANVPADLEVMCLKCLEKDQHRRYATAGELANDLRRWLRGEPILARPVGPWVRLWMWCKRKPALAATSAALAAALLIGVIAVTWQWRVAVRLRELADKARDRAVSSERAAIVSEKAAVTSEQAAQAARAQADQNAQTAGIQATLALNTIQDLITQVQKNLTTPNVHDFKTALLDSAISRVDKVADVYDKSTSREATTLAALFELGRIYRQLGQTEKVFRTFERCLAIAKERIVIKEGSDASRQNVANSYIELALSAEEYRRDMKAALEYNREALKTWQEIVDHPKPAGFPIDPQAAGFWLAESHMRVGIGHYRLGELEAARDEYRKSYNLRLALVDKYPDEPSFKQDLTYSLMALAETSFRLGDPKLAGELYSQVIDQRSASARDRPNDPLARSDLAAVQYMVGEFKMKTGELASAHDHLQASRDLRMRLVESDPKNAVYRRDLGITWYRLGNLADIEKKSAEARVSFEKALALRQELVNASATNDRGQMELMLALAHTGESARAEELADRLAAGPAVDRELRVDLARCYAQCGRSTPAAQAERTQTLLVKAIESLRAAVKEGYRDRVSLETEPDLEPLRDRTDFKALLAF